MPSRRLRRLDAPLIIHTRLIYDISVLYLYKNFWRWGELIIHHGLILHIIRYVQILKQLFISLSSSELTVILVPPMVSVPEDNGTVNVCLETNIGIKEPLEVDVTASEKGEPGSACEWPSMLSVTCSIAVWKIVDCQSSGPFQFCNTFPVQS